MALDVAMKHITDVLMIFFICDDSSVLVPSKVCIEMSRRCLNMIDNKSESQRHIYRSRSRPTCFFGFVLFLTDLDNAILPELQGSGLRLPQRVETVGEVAASSHH